MDEMSKRCAKKKPRQSRLPWFVLREKNVVSDMPLCALLAMERCPEDTFRTDEVTVKISVVREFLIGHAFLDRCMDECAGFGLGVYVNHHCDMSDISTSA